MEALQVSEEDRWAAAGLPKVVEAERRVVQIEVADPQIHPVGAGACEGEAWLLHCSASAAEAHRTSQRQEASVGASVEVATVAEVHVEVAELQTRLADEGEDLCRGR